MDADTDKDVDYNIDSRMDDKVAGVDLNRLVMLLSLERLHKAKEDFVEGMVVEMGKMADIVNFV